jgi:hypothetical protein
MQLEPDLGLEQDSKMRRYYLHLVDRERIWEDPEGFDFPHPESARNEALRSARELWQDALTLGRDLSDHVFMIVDADGNLHASVPFCEVLRAAEDELYGTQRLAA